MKPPFHTIAARTYSGLLRLLGSAVAVLGLAGCSTVEDHSLTYRLWENPDLVGFYRPANPPRTEFYSVLTKHDILVEYDELSERSGKVQRRAFLAKQNQQRIEARRKPAFLSQSKLQTLERIPLTKEASKKSEHRTGSSPHAIQKQNEDYEVVDESCVDTCHLPVYPHPATTPVKVVLTPFAVAGDATMMGVVIGFTAALMYAYGGGPY